MKKALWMSLVAASLSSFARPVPGQALKERLEKGPEVIGIVHWGLNTYTDREWGYGNENPAILAPRAFDARQIVQAAKSGGIGGLVIVAKHHDGFCLWPTKTTPYNITKAPFRSGRGDYVKEFEQACRAEGLEFGVYVSPWDRNSEFYGGEKYVEIYHEQIKELLGGEYGEIFEMWFDGANGGGGWYGGANERRTIPKGYYRFDEVFAFVRAMQPKITIFGGDRDDSDFRWPGNERGALSDDSRATVKAISSPGFRAQMNTGSKDGEFFRACEADFPLRRGWFFHESENGTAKSGLTLARIYLGTAGNGGTMNIGIAPDKDGVLVEEDAKALRDFGLIKSALFANEVVEADSLFNIVEMREDLALGERVDGWRLAKGGQALLQGEAIGARRIRLLEKPSRLGDVEFEITAGEASEHDVKLRYYYAPQRLVDAILGADTSFEETDTALWMGEAEGKESGK